MQVKKLVASSGLSLPNEFSITKILQGRVNVRISALLDMMVMYNFHVITSPLE